MCPMSQKHPVGVISYSHKDGQGYLCEVIACTHGEGIFLSGAPSECPSVLCPSSFLTWTLVASKICSPNPGSKELGSLHEFLL